MSGAGTLRWTLPQPAYTDADVFAADVEHVFARAWTFAGHSCELGPGDWFRVTLGRDQVIVVRDHDGTLHAHHDVCAHRGSRVTTAERGTARAFVCPYHQWVYGLDGCLRSARLMGENFTTAGVRLAPAAVREVAGLVFVCPAATPDEAPAFDGFADADRAPPRAPRSGARDGRRAGPYRVAANWKTLVENNRECYHCRGSHPEFSLSNFEDGTHGDVRPNPRYDAALAAARSRWAGRGLAPDEVSFPGGSWYRFTRLPLREGFTTETLDGAPGRAADGHAARRGRGEPARRRPAEPVGARQRRLRDDHAAHPGRRGHHRRRGLLPRPRRRPARRRRSRGPHRGVAGDLGAGLGALRGRYAGVASRGYRPGPLSPVVEASVASFLDWYTARVGAPRAA